jgi:hypothetical protein
MASKATKAELRQEIRELRFVGLRMSNVCFNLGQHQRTNDQKIMYELSRNWDKIKRAEASDGA